jgi:hypothetical protein
MGSRPHWRAEGVLVPWAHGGTRSATAGRRSAGWCASALGNPFGSLFGSSRHESVLAHYVIREHARGRSLAEIVDDPYVRNRSTTEERARLLERPEVVAALGDNALEELRQALDAA